MSEYLIKYFLKILRAWRTKINIEVIPDIIMFKLICNYTILKNCKMQFVARTIHFSCLTKVSGIFRINTLRSIMFLFNQNIWPFTYIFLIFFYFESGLCLCTWVPRHLKEKDIGYIVRRRWNAKLSARRIVIKRKEEKL